VEAASYGCLCYEVDVIPGQLLGIILRNNFFPHLMGKFLLGMLAELTELLRNVDLKKTASHFHDILLAIIQKLLCRTTPVSVPVFGVGMDIKTHLVT